MEKKQFSNVVPVLIDMHSKGPSINYVVSVGGGGWGGGGIVAPKTIYCIDPTLKKDNKGGKGGQKFLILRRHSLWIAPKTKKIVKLV